MSLVNEMIKGLLPEDENKKVVAVYGGGFKPPTAGHFEVAQQALKENPDIDEFIIYYDLEQNKLLPFRTKQYFNTLPMDRTVYKANYIMSLISTNTGDGYKRATTEGEYGIYVDYKDQAKSFFNKHTWKGEIDHGNHYKTDDYMPTKLCLVHYHCRSLDQMKKKVINNVKGLGYDTTNIDSLRENLDGFGHHHVEHMIAILENTFSINTYVDPAKIKELVNFSPLASFIKGL